MICGRCYANAGHLPPYLNGEELECAGSLPLGLAAGTTYDECVLAVAPGDRLSFLTDGVVEAQSESGELFGFDRIRYLADRTASEVAQTAQSFGQQDDITVVTLLRKEDAVLTAAELPSLTIADAKHNLPA